MNADEVFVAQQLGARRNALNNGDKNFPDKVGKRLRQHEAAALAEMAVAKAYGLYWTGCGKGSEGVADVGAKWEVRSVLERHHGLIVRPSDPERPHILVFVHEPICTLIGWAFPSDIKQDRFFRNGSPQGDTAFWLVSESDLRPIKLRR